MIPNSDINSVCTLHAAVLTSSWPWLTGYSIIHKWGVLILTNYQNGMANQFVNWPVFQSLPLAFSWFLPQKKTETLAQGKPPSHAAKYKKISSTVISTATESCTPCYWPYHTLNWQGIVLITNKFHGNLTNYQRGFSSFTMEKQLQIDWSFSDHFLSSVDCSQKYSRNFGLRQITQVCIQIKKIYNTVI